METGSAELEERVRQLPLLSVKAGPRDGDEWTKRLKEEYRALISLVKHHKDSGTEWFKLEAANATGTKWQVRSCFSVFLFFSSLYLWSGNVQFCAPV